jgi:nicotinamidase/pyrazinamidase
MSSFYDTDGMKRTAVIVDVQYDFLAGGSLAVPGADKDYVQAVERVRSRFDQVILTADRHPEGHVSFSVFPPHCVAGTRGAELAIATDDSVVLLKGRSLERDEFSAFSEGKNVDSIVGDEIYVFGLAGDYCVKQTLLDLLEAFPEKRLFAVTDLIYSVDGTRYGPVDYFDGAVTFITSDRLS